MAVISGDLNPFVVVSTLDHICKHLITFGLLCKSTRNDVSVHPLTAGSHIIQSKSLSDQFHQYLHHFQQLQAQNISVCDRYNINYRTIECKLNYNYIMNIWISMFIANAIAPTSIWSNYKRSYWNRINLTYY